MEFIIFEWGFFFSVENVVIISIVGIGDNEKIPLFIIKKLFLLYKI